MNGGRDSLIHLPKVGPLGTSTVSCSPHPPTIPACVSTKGSKGAQFPQCNQGETSRHQGILWGLVAGYQWRALSAVSQR